jgi:hypothetical protein
MIPIGLHRLFLSDGNELRRRSSLRGSKTHNRALAALRARYADVSTRDAVMRYLHSTLGEGQCTRGVISQIRRHLASFARNRHREEQVSQPPLLRKPGLRQDKQMFDHFAHVKYVGLRHSALCKASHKDKRWMSRLSVIYSTLARSFMQSIERRLHVGNGRMCPDCVHLASVILDS